MQLLFLRDWFPEAVANALGWTLFHSLWQGIIAAIAAGIIIIATRRSTARLRYNLLGSVLVLFVLTTMITFSLYAIATVPTTHAPASLAITVHNDLSATTIFQPATTTPTLASQFTVYFNDHASLFVLTWALFFLFHSIKLVTGLAGIQRLKHYKRQDVPGEWLTRLEEMGERLGIRQTVRLFQSELVKVPVAIGYLKPVILVPLGLLTQLPADQTETILLHELAHIRRHDYVVNVLQRIAEAIFFFNPALLWLSSLIRQEREACCDDIVVANTHSKGSYLEALVSFQEYSLSRSGYAMAIGHNRHYLLNRVKRMMTRENKKLNLMEKIVLVISLVTVTAFTMLPKKEAVAKKQVIHTQPVIIEQKTGKETIPTVLPVSPATPISVRKPVIAKEGTAYFEILAPATRDTVPPKKTNYADLNFKSLSTNTSDDGKIKNETITAVDQNGKKYSVSKVNNKVTSLTIDDIAIPESEFSNHSVLIDKLGHSQAERNALNERMREKRTEEKRERDAERLASNKERKELDEIKFDYQTKDDREEHKRNEELRMEYQKKIKHENEKRNKSGEQRRKEAQELREEIQRERKENDEGRGKDRDKLEKDFKKKEEEFQKKWRKEDEERRKDIEKLKKEFEKKREDEDKSRKEKEKNQKNKNKDGKDDETMNMNDDENSKTKTLVLNNGANHLNLTSNTIFKKDLLSVNKNMQTHIDFKPESSRSNLFIEKSKPTLLLEKANLPQKPVAPKTISTPTPPKNKNASVDL